MAEPPRGRQQHFLFHRTREIQQAFRLAAPPTIEEPLVVLLVMMMMIMMVVTMMPVLVVAAAALVMMIEGALSGRGSPPAAALSELMMALRIGRILVTFGGSPAIGGMSGHTVCRCGRRGFASLGWLPVLAASGADLSSGHYFGRAAHCAGFAASAFCLLLG